MKKIFLFFSIIIFSLLFINKTTYAQTYPTNPKQLNYLTHTFDRENAYTYEFYVIFTVSVPVFENIDIEDYFLVNNINVVFRRGINRNTNSYELEDKIVLTSGNTEFYFRITVLKTIVDTDYPSEEELTKLFNEDIAMYVDYLDPDNTEYTRGYTDGYNSGYDVGYDRGYNIGFDEGVDYGYEDGYDMGYSDGIRASGTDAYNRGYNKGAADSFISKLHIWLVPAIIIVVVAGIFVGYRRGGSDND